MRVKKNIFIFSLFLIFTSVFSFMLYAQASEEDYEKTVEVLKEETLENINNNPVPLLLEGIWSNKNRYVVFDTSFLSSADSSIPQIILKTFYGLYNDRAQESREYTESHKRDVNAVTGRAKALEIKNFRSMVSRAGVQMPRKIRYPPKSTRGIMG